VRSSSLPLSIQKGGQCLRTPDVALLCAFGPTGQQDNKVAAPLREIDAPSGSDVDAKFGDAVAY